MINVIRLFLSILLIGPVLQGNAQIGDPAPDFTVTDTHGEQHRLYDYLDAGKVVVLDFFYTTCIPCQFYSPQVNLAYEKYGCNEQDVIFMGIDYNDTDAEVLAYDEEYAIQYPSISGLNGGGNGVVNAYGILGFPTFYVIDSTRKIIEVIDPPTLQVFDFRFNQHGIEPAECGVTSISTVLANDSVIEIYPNPAIGSLLTIAVADVKGEDLQYTISDALGREVQTGHVVLDYEGRVEIGIDGIGPGVYFASFFDPVSGWSRVGQWVRE